MKRKASPGRRHGKPWPASLLSKQLTRRDFIKYSLAGVAALATSGYFLGRHLKPEGLANEGSRAPEELWKWSREAYYYEKLGRNRVKCMTCPNGCVLSENGRSHCRSKINLSGKLYSIAYGNPCALHVDPIEKKPLFHFLPGTSAFSIAAAGCTFRCLNCQNWEISQSNPEWVEHFDMMPERVVEAASSRNAESIAYTYSEPTSFYEYMLDTSALASKAGVRNIWVTNGSINRQPLTRLCRYLDAANVDLKAFDNSVYSELCSGSKEPVLECLKTLREQHVWVEITYLMVPQYTDSLEMVRDMCSWLYENGFEDYPIHFSRFHPAYKLSHLPSTPVSVLESARSIAFEAGLKYAYIGNVPGHDAQSTYCPGCSTRIIEREGYSIKKNDVDPLTGRCMHCGERIAGVWKA